MDAKLRKRAMRNFLGSLLQSDLTAREMRILSEDLIFGSLGRDIGEYIRDVIDESENQTAKSGPRYDEIDQSDSSLANAMEIINRRRLSKKMIIQIMKVVSPKLKLSSETSLPVKELVDRYLMATSHQEKAKFLSILQGDTADPYMKGIAKHNRG